MITETIEVLKDLLKEYELRAKYNGGHDYRYYRGLTNAIKELEGKEVEEPKERWRDADDTPDNTRYVLLSLENSPELLIGRYIENPDGSGTYYEKGNDEPLNKWDLFVEAWRELPERYQAPKDALKMAIKTLEQEPCEDCISRQIISDYVESHIQEINTGYGDLNSHTNRILRMIVDYIEKSPSVEPRRLGE